MSLWPTLKSKRGQRDLRFWLSAHSSRAHLLHWGGTFVPNFSSYQIGNFCFTHGLWQELTNHINLKLFFCAKSSRPLAAKIASDSWRCLVCFCKMSSTPASSGVIWRSISICFITACTLRSTLTFQAHALSWQFWPHRYGVFYGTHGFNAP